MKNLKIKSIYELNNYDYKKLGIKKSDGYDSEWRIFEGDCDYLVDKNGYTLYFLIYGNTVYTSDINTDYDDILLEFCNGQNTKITKSGNSYRYKSGKWQYFDKNTRDEFENYNGLKIAYRGGAGYWYTLFKYIG